MDPAVAALDIAKAGVILANMIESYLAGGAPPSNPEGAEHDDLQDRRSTSVAGSLHLHSSIDDGAGPLQPGEHLAPCQSHGSPHRCRLCSRLEELADVHFAKAKTIALVQDNLNIHSKASLYEAFPAAEARRLVERFEWHYTPKHGSWLDLAESELGILSSQCLDRRIPDKQTLIDEIAAWEHDRNANHTKANWHFTTPNARIKLRHLYPSI